MSQVRVAVGIANHVWQEKHAAIAATVDALGDRSKPELRAGWLGYIRETYPDWPVAPAAFVGEEKFSAMNTHPNRIFDFWNNGYKMK